MSTEEIIKKKLAQGINAQHLELINESHKHNVPPGSESHFKLVLVSNDFIDQNLLARHRMVHDILADELQNRIHALALHTYTEQEWQDKQNKAPASPPCRGGDKQHNNA